MSDLGGMVFSTDPHYEFEQEQEEISGIPWPSQQLTVRIDKKQRKGKVVTLVEGFVGSEEEFAALSKILKGLCGAGGSYKDGVVLVQGEFRQRIADHLKKEGARVKILG